MGFGIGGVCGVRGLRGGGCGVRGVNGVGIVMERRAMTFSILGFIDNLRDTTLHL